MPLYEYYCRQCEDKFELLRPMSRSDEPATCSRGHQGAQRVLSPFSSFSKGADGSLSPVAGSVPACSSCAATSCATCDLV
jgi:putative FmdB family regulatory protein